MSEYVTLNLPEDLARGVKQVAERSQRRVEDVLVDWINKALSDLPVESLPDEEVLALCALQMDEALQQELSLLLQKNREGQLDEIKRNRLDEIMKTYREGMIRKAQAWNVAVARGLKASPN